MTKKINGFESNYFQEFFETKSDRALIVLSISAIDGYLTNILKRYFDN